MAPADTHWMTRALELAALGRYGASPNPMVGAVVVNVEGRVVGEGHHTAFGRAHAEVEALQSAGEQALDSTLYVTLEPCNHHGKTPPCADAILNAGVRRVVVAMRDPNRLAAGGLERLQENGVVVDIGVGSTEAARLNRRWLHWMERRRPWVTLKAAVSLDGRIATRTGESQWITGEAARRRGLELREEHDAILVGIGTVLADNPRLTRRLGLNPINRWRRIILDSGLRTPVDAVVVRELPQLTIIAHTGQAPADRAERLADIGVRLLELPADETGRVHLNALLERLADEDVSALLVEGGARVNGSFADAYLVDEAVFFIAPMLIGGTAPAAIGGSGVAKLTQATQLRFEEIQRHGDDIELRAVRREASDVHWAG